MPAKKRKKPAAGGGKPANNEPRVQLFSKFGGIDFSQAPRDIDFIFDPEAEDQTDLMQNMMVIQNNAGISGMGTIETRQNLVELFQAPAGKTFKGVNALIGNQFFAATTDKTISYGTLESGVLVGNVPIYDDDPALPVGGDWTAIGQADGQLVALSTDLRMWTGDYGTSPSLRNAIRIPDPTNYSFWIYPTASTDKVGLMAYGDLAIDIVPRSNASDPAWSGPDIVFRVGIQFCFANKFGPTRTSSMYYFYASKPVSEWTQTDRVTVRGAFPKGIGIEAVDLYFVEGESSGSAFLGRVSQFYENNEWNPFYSLWLYNWTGYNLDTKDWSKASLTPLEENLTTGPPASKMTVIDGRLYFWGGEPKHRIWIGGGPGNRFSFSPGTGGGWVDCNPGQGTVVRKLLKFKTQQGAAIVTALCDNANSQEEHRYNLVESNISLSDVQSSRGWMAEEIAGTVGTKSYDGAVVASDGLYTISRYGLAVTTLTMEYNSQLQVQYVSDQIEPIFLDQLGSQFKDSHLFFINGVIYMSFGTGDGEIDNVLFCYDVSLKAWWTYTLDVDSPILSMLHIDHEGSREGIGIVTANKVYLLPTTKPDAFSSLPNHEVLIETAELTTMQPLQARHHLSQLEFRFDYFVGWCDIIVTMVDQFGRKIETKKRVKHDEMVTQLAESIRIDQVVESYKIAIKGPARFRLTHFLAKNYPKSNRIGMVWGFDSQQSHTSAGSIHRTFSSYNDVREAIIP